MKYFLYGVGTVVFICLLLAAIPFAFSLMLFGSSFSEHTLNMMQEIPSPNGRYIATSYTDMGGGAAGWCMAEVNVRTIGEELPPSEDVFACHCGTKVELSWDSDSQLTIKFTPDDIAFGVRQSSQNKDGSVRIRYIEGKPDPKNNGRTQTRN